LQREKENDVERDRKRKKGASPEAVKGKYSREEAQSPIA